MLRGFRFGLVCTLLLTFGASAELHANNPFGSLVPVPNLSIPGTPEAELNINGEAFLLLSTDLPLNPIEAQLWNPTNSIPLVFPATVTANDIEGVTGMQTAQGPRVFFWGDFEVSGVATRLIEWDGTNWDLPGGAVEGITPSAVAVRQTGGGPELWCWQRSMSC